MLISIDLLRLVKTMRQLVAISVLSAIVVMFISATLSLQGIVLKATKLLSDRKVYLFVTKSLLLIYIAGVRMRMFVRCYDIEN